MPASVPDIPWHINSCLYSFNPRNNLLMIIKNTNNRISQDFVESEFFTKDPGYNADGHYLDDRLIDAVQYLRTLFGERIIITSSYRSAEYNARIGGAMNSFHTQGRAVDFQFLKRNKELISEVENSPEIRQRLKEIGINGLLFYPNFMHIDTRINPFSKRYS